MKKTVVFFTLLITCVAMFAQSGPTFPYQAVVRNSQNQLIKDSTFAIDVEVYQATELKYKETQNVTTNANGQFAMNIGGGTVVSGALNDITDWSVGKFKMTYHLSGGDIVSEDVVHPVPYTLQAGNAGERQVLSLSNDTIYLTGGSYVKLPDYVLRAVMNNRITDTLNDYSTADQLCNVVNACDFSTNVTLVAVLDEMNHRLDSLNHLADSLSNLPHGGDTIIAITDTIAFLPNGGQGTMDTMFVTRGNTVLNANAYTHDGNWQFLGWNTEADGSGTSYADGAAITTRGNLTLYAQWRTWCTGTPQANELGTSRIDSVKDVDNNQYAVVQIGNQCWLKENLRTSNIIYSIGNVYTNPAEGYDVNTYGRLYDWAAVMQGASSSNANPSGVQGICPTGWHVPSDAEWDTLTTYVKSQSDYVSDGCSDTDYESAIYCIAKALASTAGWNNSSEQYAVGNKASANNATGFSVVPAGSYYNDYEGFGSNANFWSATQDEYNYDDAFYCYLDFEYNHLGKDYYLKSSGYSIRCVRNVETPAAMSATTDSAASVTSSSATLYGNVTSLADNAEVTAGFRYGQHPDYMTFKAESTVSAAGSFNAELSNISPNTTYYFQAYAATATDTAWADNTLTFTTLTNPCSVVSLRAGTALVGGKFANKEYGSDRKMDSVSDHEGNVYRVVEIGRQCWLAENMRATTSPRQETMHLQEGTTLAYEYPLYYKNSDATQFTLRERGYLYNWAAAMDTTYSVGSLPGDVNFPGRRGICPEGWHLPTDDEWFALEKNVLTDFDFADAAASGTGYRGKGAGQFTGGIQWTGTGNSTTPNSYSYADRNSTGFSALPVGFYASTFRDVYSHAIFHSATSSDGEHAWLRELYNSETGAARTTQYKDFGFSVRCVRNMDPLSATTDSAASVTNNSATLYGNVTSLADNAEVTAGLRYGQHPDYMTLKAESTVSAAGSYNAELSNLSPNTTYYFQAYAATATDTAWADNTLTFTTLTNPCSVVSLRAGTALVGGKFANKEYGSDRKMDSVSDHEGNVYRTVQIGRQCWLAENMRATTEPDGGSIVLNADSSSNTTPMAYSSDVARYGYLYNFAAAMNIDDNRTTFTYPHRGICPEGWHIPTDDEWTTLTTEAGVGINGGTGAGKLAGGNNWNAYNAATYPGNYDYAERNSTGFSALPAGYGDEDGANSVGYRAYFWSATPNGYNEAYIWDLYYAHEYIYKYSGSRSYGYSVRCVRNAAVTTDSATAVNTTSATLHGTLTEMPDETSSTVGFRYGIHSDSLTATVTTTATAAGPFSCDIHDLTRATLYYYQAFETNGTDTLFGETNNFLTLPEPCPGMPTVADHEGNIYRTVQIGSQCWMAENMRATTEPNGRTIVLNDDDYSYIRPMAYSSDVARYGYLYNFPAAMNIASNTTDFSYPHRGICPEGWHIPTNEEWTTLANEAGVGINSGTGAGKLTFGNNWRTHNAATAPGNYAYADRNNTGFSALPAGYGYEDVIYYVGDYTYFWSATPDGDDDAYDWELYYDYEYISEVSDSRYYGLSVRCVYDGVVSTGSADNITPNSATLHGNLMEMLDETSVTVGFRYGTQSDSLTATVTTTATAAGPFICNINNLTHNTTYYFQAFETNGTDTLWGGTNHFLTLPKPCPGMPTVTDHEGNVYPTVQIGSQCWTAENMRATTEPDGGTIVLNDDDHSNTEPMAYSSNVARYGYLYNFPAAMNIDDYDTTFTHPHRGICPVGWHIPTNDEWTALANEAGVGINSGTGAGKLTVGNNWYSGDNDYATYPGNHDYAERNSTGFSALPAGYGYDDGVSDVGYDAYFWSATPNVYNEAYIWDLYYAYEYIYKYSGSRYYGRSVRCVLDEGVKVYTGSADNITPNSATLHGNLMEMLDETSVTVGFRYGTQSDSLTATVTTTATAAGPFSCDIHNLTRNTTYYYQAFATDGTDTLWGTTQSFTAQFNPCSGASTVTDHEDNVYRTVAIGSQCWMAENMRAITEPDGSSIVRNADSTSNTTPMAYSSDVDKYGYLYNFAAAMNIADSSTTFTYPHRGICPEGWHIPTNKEWTDLANAAGVGINGGTGAGKLVVGENWNSGSYNYATYPGNYDYAERNSTGFSALPAGYGNSSGANSVGYYTYFWSATPNGTTGAYSWYLGYDYEYINKYADSRDYGNSVRCVRDAAVTTDSVDNITTNSATLHGTLHDMGEESSSTVGFRYGTHRDNLTATVTSTATTTGPFSCNINNLTRATLYYYQAFETNGTDTLFGAMNNFLTLPEPCPGMPTVTDHEGNVYPTVQIGSQCWMAENMRATTEPDGSSIVLDADSTSNTTPMAYSSDEDEYGYLYNFAAAMNIDDDQTDFAPFHRGICPEGWHIPTNEEWTALATEAGVGINGGTGAGKLVYGNDWDDSYDYATYPGNHDYAERNVTGFSALPAGYGDEDGANSVGDYAYFWSATPAGNTYAYYWYLSYYNEYISESSDDRYYGYSVRCVRDAAVTTGNADNITTNSATLHGTLMEMLDETSVTVGFRYGTQSDSLTATVATTATAVGPFSCDIHNLTRNTTYYYQAFATDGTDTLWGLTKDFLTLPEPCPGMPTVTDHEGNVYPTVQIGSQCWMAENMRAITEPDGDTIRLNDYDYSYIRPMAYSSDVARYGYLYNFAAAMNIDDYDTTFTHPHRGICPVGWHIPTNDEWTALANEAGVGIGYSGTGAGKLTGGNNWYSGDYDYATYPGNHDYAERNSTGFSALPAGYGDDDGVSDVGYDAYFWSATPNGTTGAYYWDLYYAYEYIYNSSCSRYDGFSVRCVLDEGVKVYTGSADNITSNSATLHGNLMEMLDETSVTVGFRYGTQSDSLNATVTTTATAVGPFSCDIHNLTRNTTYYYQAFETDGTDTLWGTTQSFTAQFNPCSGASTVTDHEDNVYRTVAIGSQCWMAENMRAITEPDGSSIVLDANSTSNTTPMAYSSDEDEYGYLYNFAAAMNIDDDQTDFAPFHRGICPEGWHIPTNGEWTDMANAAGVGINSGTGAGKLAYGNGWEDDDEATSPGNYEYAERNSTGFSALPAGYGYGDEDDGPYAESVGEETYFWSANPIGKSGAYSWNLDYDDEYISKYSDSRYYGSSVRCVRDGAVGTGKADNITTTRATLHGTLMEMLEETSATVGFRYGTHRDNLTATVTSTATTTGPFSCDINNLNYNTTYYYQAFATDGNDTLFGRTNNFFTFPEPCPDMPTATDHEGNVYHTVQIGSQCWMAENMRATTEPDGGSIVRNADSTSNTTPMAYSSGVDRYGYLYNFAAAMNIDDNRTTFTYPHRGICPEGWHIPTNEEWTDMANAAGVGIGSGTGAGKLVIGEDWDDAYDYATYPGNYEYAERNSTGFSALPAGYGNSSGANSVGYYTYFWSATPDGDDDAYYWYLYYYNECIGKSSGPRYYGYSVRCVHDVPPVDTIAFIPNGGIGTIDTTLVERDEEVTIPANTYTHDGNWQFTGWNTEANGSGTPYAVNATFTANGNLTLYAQWSTWCAGTPLNNELGTSRIDSVKDHENNWYKVVQIGSQCWLKENMRATTEPGGSAIVLNADSASNTTPIAYSSNVAQYGYLYNFPAAMNTSDESSNFTYPHRGICPEGWHVPTNDDWALLAATANVPDYLYVPGTTEFTNGLGKLTAGTDWMASSWGTSPGYYNYIYRDSTGFSARPAGCYYDGSLDNVGESAYFWTSSEYDYYLHLFHSYGAISWGSGEFHSTGYSVRCVRNTLSAATDSATAVTTSSAILNGTIFSLGDYNTAKAGFQYGTSSNAMNARVEKTENVGVGVYNCAISGLTANTTYFYKSFVVGGSSTDTVWAADTLYFTTLSENPCTKAPTVTDADGNVYNTVKIGRQCWMAQNLRTETKRNGQGEIYNLRESTMLGAEGYDVATYGLMYDWAAVMQGADSSSAAPSGVQGICPDGWHVPSSAEWDTLTQYVFSNDAYKCGCSSTEWEQNTPCIANALAAGIWDSPESCCAGDVAAANFNQTGFSALPAGYNAGSYFGFGIETGFWSATADNTPQEYPENEEAFCWFLKRTKSEVASENRIKRDAYSVRCVRDADPVDTIAFRSNGGRGTMDTMLVTRGDTVLNANTYTNGNWRFDGWNTEADGSGTQYADQAALTTSGNLTLFAQWRTWCTGTPLSNESGTSRIDSVKDHENNWYKVVQIGIQCWLAENMRATTEPDGSTIEQTTNTTSFTTPMARTSNVDQYGYLYNFAAAMNIDDDQTEFSYPHRGICPKGWHIPSDEEWTILANEAGVGIGSGTGAGKLAAGNDWTTSSSYNLTHPGNLDYADRNITGFSALPAGVSGAEGVINVGYGANFWSATSDGNTEAYYWRLWCANEYLSKLLIGRTTTFSVRCVRDTLSITTDSASTVTNSSAKLYGNVRSLGDNATVTAGLRYGQHPDYMTSKTENTVSAAGSYNTELTNLSPNTTYYFQAYAVTATDTAWTADTLTFTTLTNPCSVVSLRAGTALDGGKFANKEYGTDRKMDSVSDHEGNVYRVVQIGSQCWLAENMRATTEPNGDTIMSNSDSYTTPMAYSSDVDKYGYLYNFPAAMNIIDGSTNFSPQHRGICPEGWHIPDNEEWTIMANEAGVGIGSNTGAGKLTTGNDWGVSNYNFATSPAKHDYAERNRTGFSVLPSGWGEISNVHSVGYFTDFWSASSTPSENTTAYSWELYYNAEYIRNYKEGRRIGQSVRCVRDLEPMSATTDSAATVTNSSAILYGNVTSLENNDEVTAGFRYGQHPDYMTFKTEGSVSDTGSYNAELTNLSPNTTYFFQAYAATATDTTWTADTLTFTTLTNPCSVTGIRNNESGTGTRIDSVKDHENNWYKVVQIGNQCWMAENMRATTEPDGDTIVLNDAGYSITTPMAYSSDVDKYGYLYNFPAAMDINDYRNEFNYPHRGICPEGWHIPTNDEWNALADEAGVGIGSGTGAGKLTTGNDWHSSTDYATAPGNYGYADRNSSGFAALSAGSIDHGDYDYEVGTFALFLSSNPGGTYNAHVWDLSSSSESIGRFYGFRERGYSVRCLRDVLSVTTNNATTVTSSSAKLYGNVVSLSDDYPAKAGFKYGTSSNALNAKIEKNENVGVGAYNCDLTGLNANTTYFYKSFVVSTNSTDTVWAANTLHFTTPDPCLGASTITDADGNVYNTVKIGNQCWMKENLRTTKKPNSETITDGMWEPDDHTLESYGRLYSWTTVMNGASSSSANPSGVQGICPTGWHVPSDNEWKQMEMAVGMSQNDADDDGEYRGNIAAKLCDNTSWTYSSVSNAAGNFYAPDRNSSGFSARPAGFYYDAHYANFGLCSMFWSATESSDTGACSRTLSNDEAGVYRYYYKKYYGFSVRCVRD